MRRGPLDHHPDTSIPPLGYGGGGYGHGRGGFYWISTQAISRQNLILPTYHIFYYSYDDIDQSCYLLMSVIFDKFQIEWIIFKLNCYFKTQRKLRFTLLSLIKKKERAMFEFFFSYFSGCFFHKLSSVLLS